MNFPELTVENEYFLFRMKVEMTLMYGVEPVFQSQIGPCLNDVIRQLRRGRVVDQVPKGTEAEMLSSKHIGAENGRSRKESHHSVHYAGLKFGAYGASQLGMRLEAVFKSYLGMR